MMNKDVGVAEVSHAYLIEAAERAVPIGYKQTGVGVIPEDWLVLSISENHQVATGNTPPPSDKSNYGESYLFASPADLGEKKNIYQTEKMLSLKGFALSRRFPAGSTLFTCIGSTIGKTGYACFDLTSNQQINAVFPNLNNDSHFTYYALTYLAPRVKVLAGEQAVPLVNKTEFGETKYPLPSTKIEQTAIANALSDVDALLSELEKLIAKKQAIKTATMQKLLTGRTRLPQFALRKDGSVKGYKQSELGEVPEDWSVLTLGDVGKFKNGINKSADDFGYGSPFVNLMDVFGKPSISCIENLGLINSTDLEKKEYSLEKGDILFIRSSVKPTGVGLTSVVLNELTETVYSGFLIRFRSGGKLEINFKKYCFYDEGFRKRIISGSTVSANTNINQDVLKAIPIAFPSSVKEQTAIATILSNMDEEIQALEQRLSKTRQIKQGMMQELLTGRTRLLQLSAKVAGQSY
ncbi:type I restriction enzyme S subunit [Marinobacter sp. LV10MA510-1]|nr:type I restriction enzyme S subunit [Marinobacter sp. LV10MA510-1]